MLPRALRNIRDGLIGLAFPEECRLCRSPVESWDYGVVCRDCWNDPALTRILDSEVCTKCGAPGAPATANVQANSTTSHSRACGKCAPAPFTAARASGIYSGAFEASILFLKVTPHICPRLRRIICQTFSDHRDRLRSDVVIPVPLHRLRKRQRGFNQAELIARLISRKFGLTFDDRSLIRIKPTERHRAGMDANDRAQSIERAFEVVNSRPIRGASILLVDDVYTTGSTICEATVSLFDAGAEQVNVLTIARVAAR